MTSEAYVLSVSAAEAVLEEVMQRAACWEEHFAELGVAKREIELLAERFTP